MYEYKVSMQVAKTDFVYPDTCGTNTSYPVSTWSDTKGVDEA